MDKALLLGIVISATILGSVYMLSPAESLITSVPPTRAFAKVVTDNGVIEASVYTDDLVVPRSPFAQLSDLTTQQCAAGGAASNVTINTNDGLFAITHSTSTNTHEIIMQKNGTYQIIAVPQIGEAAVQADGIHNFWMMKNGTKVANSNIKTNVMLQASGAETMTGTLQWVGNLRNNDVIYFQQSCTDQDIGIIFSADTAIEPATPSIIVSIIKIDW